MFGGVPSAAAFARSWALLGAYAGSADPEPAGPRAAGGRMELSIGRAQGQCARAGVVRRSW